MDYKKEIKQIQELEKKIRSDKKNINEINKLIEKSQKSDICPVILAALRSLKTIFLELLGRKEFQLAHEVKRQKTSESSEKSAADSAKEKVKAWVKKTYNAYIQSLLGYMHCEEPILRAASIGIAMDLAKEEVASTRTTKQYTTQMTEGVFKHVVVFLVCHGAPSQETFGLFKEQYLHKLDDIRYFTLINLRDIVMARSKTDAPIPEVRPPPSPHNTFMRNVFSLVEGLNMPRAEEDLNAFFHVVERDPEPAPEASAPSKKRKARDMDAPDITLQEHRKVFSIFWTSFLCQPLPTDVYKKVLLQMHKSIIPFLTSPILLVDFLKQTYDKGGVYSLLALNGLFLLMTKYNLDYPDFYNKLYLLLQPEVFHVKYRARFFKLLDLFLSSTHLPVYLVAAFAKRMARLLLTAPASGCLFGLAFIHNLIDRHPAAASLIHRGGAKGFLRTTFVVPLSQLPKSEDEGDLYSGEDPFVFEQPEPAKCNAIKSSLWEVKTLCDHSYPGVAKLAMSFEDKFRGDLIDVDKYVNVSYPSIVEREIKKKYKKSTALAYAYSEQLEDTFLDFQFD